MLLNTPFYLQNFYRAPFLLKLPPNLFKYYKFNSRKSENIKIRHCLIDQATTRSKSGGCLIDQAPARSKSGGCLIDQAPARSKSGGGLIDQAAT